jgi:hypothetical protein
MRRRKGGGFKEELKDFPSCVKIKGSRNRRISFKELEKVVFVNRPRSRR